MKEKKTMSPVSGLCFLVPRLKSGEIHHPCQAIRLGTTQTALSSDLHNCTARHSLWTPLPIAFLIWWLTLLGVSLQFTSHSALEKKNQESELWHQIIEQTRRCWVILFPFLETVSAALTDFMVGMPRVQIPRLQCESAQTIWRKAVLQD